jgi:NAD(P)-dependent dehydrogenase (short-subunit alcohol dehydrogenase family)
MHPLRPCLVPCVIKTRTYANIRLMKVLVTGASGGLGGVVSCALLGAGHMIAGLARSWKDEQKAEGFVPIAADLNSPSAAQAAVENAARALGGIDAVIHTVGGFAGGTNVEETSVKDAQKMFDMNFWPAFHLAHAVLPHFRAQGHGRFVAIGALAATRHPATLGAYSASKAALRTLVLTIAAETKNSGITANLISPGTMDTAANRGAMPDADPSLWIPPKNVASLALWLLSAEAASVTGQDLAVTGRD